MVKCFEKPINKGLSRALSVLMFLLCLGGAVVYTKSNMKEEVWEKGR